MGHAKKFMPQHTEHSKFIKTASTVTACCVDRTE